MQWPDPGGSKATGASHDTNDVKIGPCCDADAQQPAMEVIADADRHHDDHAQLPQPVNPAPAPVSAVRLSARCVLLTYFDGDVSNNVDEHFSRSLKAAATDHERQDDERHAGALRQQLYRKTTSKYRANSLHCTHSTFTAVRMMWLQLLIRTF